MKREQDRRGRNNWKDETREGIKKKSGRKEKQAKTMKRRGEWRRKRKVRRHKKKKKERKHSGIRRTAQKARRNERKSDWQGKPRAVGAQKKKVCVCECVCEEKQTREKGRDGKIWKREYSRSTVS